jgi:hypothetical protein
VRRLTIELYGPELDRRLQRSAAFSRIREMEVLHILRYDEREVAMVCRIVLRDPSGDVEACFRDDPTPTKVSLLGREMVDPANYDPSAGAIVLIRRAMNERFLFGTGNLGPEAAYIQPPFFFRSDRVTFTLVGSQAQFRSLLRDVERRGIQYRVLSLLEASFGPDSPIRLLTEQQRRVILTAHRLGYYDVPRRTSSAEIAAELQLSAGTVAEHLRKAEGRVFREILEPPRPALDRAHHRARPD